MKKFICFLVILISFTLAAPMSFGIPCSECYDICYDIADDCTEDYYDCLDSCGSNPDCQAWCAWDYNYCMTQAGECWEWCDSSCE